LLQIFKLQLVFTPRISACSAMTKSYGLRPKSFYRTRSTVYEVCKALYCKYS